MVKLLLPFIFTIGCFLNFYGQEIIYNYPGSDNIIGTKCHFFRTKEDFVKNKNIDSAVFDIQVISELTFDIRTFIDRPKRQEINAMYCIITPSDTLFNLRSYDIGIGYSKRIIIDSFHILFQSQNDNNYLTQFGLLGAALSSGMRINLSKYLTMAVNQNDGSVIYVTKQSIKSNLKTLKDEEMVKAFSQEKEYSMEVMLKYFKYFMANRHKIKER